MFTRNFLRSVRRKAFRRGLWYSALDRADREFLILTSRVVDVVRSINLGVVIVKILAKLRNALKSEFVRHMETRGMQEAKKIAEQAIALGNNIAWAWAYDFDFVRYLTVMDLNRPTGWGLL